MVVNATCSPRDHNDNADTSQSAKSKHRPSKKRQAGRKGTVDEYDYLVASIGRLVKRVDDKSGTYYLNLRSVHPQRPVFCLNSCAPLTPS